MKITRVIYLLVLFTVLSCKTHQKINSVVNPANESSELLSHFNVYRGNSHSHTIFTWTHGEHREKGINDLSSPTEFHPDWHIPPGVDWRDYNTVSLDPTGYTNRQGLPENHFELAIANGYDFYAISDHTQEPNLQPVSEDNATWRATIRAAEKYNRPDFVALAGFEYSRNTNKNGGSGHINVLNSSTYVNADHGQRGPVPDWPEANWSVPQFYDWVKKNAKPYNNEGYVAVGFNHPSLKQYDDWANIDDEIVEIISTFEIHTNYRQNRWDAYIRALNKGWKLSPIGVHDNHGYSPILNKKLPPPTLVLAPELTKEAITKALCERRTFASWNEGVELRYAVNNHIMGSTIDKSPQYEFFIEIITPMAKDNERVRCIQILRDHPSGEGTSIVAEQFFEGDQDKVVWDISIKDEDAKYYLLQVFHENDKDNEGKYKKNGSTVSAPVWIKK